VHFFDKLAMASPETLKVVQPDFGRVADDGLGAVVEYEFLRRNRRSDLPSLSDVSDSAAVRVVTEVLDGSKPRRPHASLRPEAVEAVRISGAFSMGLEWRAFIARMQIAARRAGFASSVAEALAGAVGELADNVLQHSESEETGIAAFAQGDAVFEYVVADCGIGMLASLRRNEEYRGLRDDMEALPLAVSAGVSRYGQRSGRGYGYRAVFLPLRAADGVVRLRSGSAVVEVASKGPGDDSGVCSQRPFHPGVTVAARLSHA
jgi:hypothetical protein